MVENMLDLLSDTKIVNYLSPPVRSQLGSHLVILPTVDSTNDFLWRHPTCKVCLAEHQTAGRGRQGRRWISPYRSGLYLSIRCTYTMDLGAVNVGGLSVALTVSIVKLLRNWGVDCQIKWCNDIICQDRKLAGLLLETRLAVNSSCVSGEKIVSPPSLATNWAGVQSSAVSNSRVLEVVMGLGINVQLPTECLNEGWTDLRQVLPTGFSRNKLAAAMIQVSWQCLTDYGYRGLTGECLKEWQALDRLYQQPVWLKLADNKWVYGTALGIDQQGALQIQEGNLINRYVHGEVTVRRNSGDLHW